jgi:adenylosuccinate synthase
VGPTKIHAVIGVAKAYTTRVGAGPFVTELPEAASADLRRRGKEFGATTGRPRRCGWFDAVMVRHAVRVNGMDSLAITKLDVLDEMVKVKICTGYKYKGRILKEYPMATSVLEKCQPVYEELPGWHATTRGARSWFDLPPKARYYLEKIAEHAEAKIGIISVGCEREETVWVTT